MQASRRAFTLAEVLLSVGILAMALVARLLPTVACLCKGTGRVKAMVVEVVKVTETEACQALDTEVCLGLGSSVVCPCP